jgi:DNA-binding NtrC family response regulator
MQREKVLVVDDEPMIRWSVREALTIWDYEVIEAETGEQALAALADDQIKVVLLDINLPDSSGLDLLPEIKRRRPQVAVIMVTAETFYEAAVSALRGGARDFIGKPINLNQLRFALGHLYDTDHQDEETVAPSKPAVLVISDVAERIPHLQSVINSNEAEVTSVVYPEEWEYVGAGKHDLVLIDVGPELLNPLLKTVRSDSGLARIPVLVDNSRIMTAANIAGIMPMYRAMPCGHDEMVRLARRHISANAGHGETRSFL